MGAINDYNRFSEVDNLSQAWLIPLAGGTAYAVGIGDACYDGGLGIAYPANVLADQGSLAANQELFNANFIGFSQEQILLAETNTSKQYTIRTEGVVDVNCISGTYEPGMLMGLNYGSGSTGLDPQTLIQVYDVEHAIGIVVPSKYNNATTTRIRIYFQSRRSSILYQAIFPNQVANFRNLIDGGDFTVNPWQRGTSFASISNTLTYTADRFFAAGASTSSISVSQQSQTDVVGFSKSLRFGRANTDTATIYLGQVLETLDCIRCQGQQVTLSFWAKAGAQFSGANLVVQLNHSTTAGNDSAAHLVAASTNWQATPKIINSTCVPTTTATRYTFTGVVPANATQLGMLLSYTPTGTSDSTDTIDFYGFQLEIGPNASVFEHRDVAVELEICQRFCYVVGGTTGVIGSGAATSTTAAGFYIPFPVQMRIAPTTLTVATVGDLSVYTYANASVAALSALAFGSASVNSVHATATSSGMTSGVPYVLYVATALVGNVVFSADL